MAQPAVKLYQLAKQEHFFRDVQDALRAVRSYTERLRRFGREQNRMGRELCDQCYPTDVFALRPKNAIARPLVLIGGMGPLAGASGFERACRRFLNTKEIVLFQACSIPDRTRTLIKSAEAREQCSPEHMLLTESLESSINEAAARVSSDEEPFKLIVLCNTCHFVLPETLRRLNEHQPHIAARLGLISLIDSTIETIKQRGYGRIMAVYTLGTRLSRIYSRRFREEGLSFIESTGTLEQSLMRSIFKGVKAFDEATSMEAGTRFFNELLATEPEFDCIVAGCTELPFVVNGLIEKGSDRIKAFLRSTEVIDPVSAALSLV